MNTSEITQLVSYDPLSGLFIWRSRAKKNGKPNKSFNTAFAGKQAGCKRKSDGYTLIRIRNKLLLAHRLAWSIHYGYIDINLDIDHINGDKSDNRISNLRLATRMVNMQNSSKSKLNKTGITGVHIRADTGKFSSEIMVDYKKISLGCFDNIFDAACARKSAERLYGFHYNHGR